MKESIELRLLEVLHGKKTVLVCERIDIEREGVLIITDEKGNAYNEKYLMTIPRSCFSKKNVMLLNISNPNVSLGSTLCI